MTYFRLMQCKDHSTGIITIHEYQVAHRNCYAVDTQIIRVDDHIFTHNPVGSKRGDH